MANILNQDPEEKDSFTSENEKISQGAFQWKPIDISEINISQEIQEVYTTSNNTFIREAKSNPKDRIEVEVGDVMQSDFYPQVKLKRWDNEVNFSARLVTSEETPQVVTEGNKIKWKGDKVEVHSYEYPDSQDHPEGAYEFEVILKEKPASNVLSFTIQTKDLDFFYQPELTQEEIDEGASRPDEVVGSYAVYHKTKGGMNDAAGMEYKVGKAFHIFRPKVTDANSNEVWGELNVDIENGLLAVTIDQTFLDNAVYPVVVDPTFGYLTAGGTAVNLVSDQLTAGLYGTSVAGNLDSITAWLRKGNSPTSTYKYAIYSDTTKMGESTTNNEADLTTTATEYLIAMNSEVLSASTNYYLVIFCDGNTSHYVICYRDDTGGNSAFQTTTYPTFPDPATWTTGTRKYSFYATYTAGGGESASNSPSLSPSASISPSPSLSPSASLSPSPSLSPSRSNSPSLSPSGSLSPSASASPSLSPSRSLSPSVSASPSLSPSGSLSPSSTPSPSVSPSASPSLSPSISGSPSLSPSASLSPSSTPSPSLSPSNSLSPSSTPSPSSSPSASLSPSGSPSPSLSPSGSLSPSESGSPSLSPSVSGSPSLSPSFSESPSLSPSSTKSPSLSPSESLSPSGTPSPSESPSSTESPSLSPSLSASPSLSPSESASPSLSPSSSQSPSLSPSISASSSLSPSSTESPSASPSSSLSPSLSLSPSASASPSAEYDENSPHYLDAGSRYYIRISGSRISSWNIAGRPTGKEGLIGGNTETGNIEWFDGSNWLNADGSGV